MKYTVLLLAAALAACSYSSTPLTSTHSIKAENGVQRYRVACAGLLGGKGACDHRAEEICREVGKKPVGKFENDAFIFQCAAPKTQVR